MLFDIPLQLLYGQLLLGLINGSFYALMSLGLAVIFGMLRVINFTHGAQYMLGALATVFLLKYLGLGYWWALIVAPLVVGALGILIEVTMLRRVYRIDHLYGLLLTLGIAAVIEGVVRVYLGSSGLPYRPPVALQGAFDLGFMRLPIYRGWVVAASLVICIATWLTIEYTRLGSYLRAATENPRLVRAFGIRVPLLLTLTYGFGVALAGLAGVMAAPIYSVTPSMGADLLILTFAIVVIGGMGSILGAIATGFGLGVIQGLTMLFLPIASETVIFVVMALILLLRPGGLFGRSSGDVHQATEPGAVPAARQRNLWRDRILFLGMLVTFLILPWFVYPMVLMKILCFALIVVGYNQLLGYTGLISFGHAMFVGWGGYVTAHVAKEWGVTPELSLVVGALVGATLGLLVGALAIRRQGIYFAMITLAFAQMFYFFAVQAPFTGGEDGIQAVPRGRLFGILDLSNMMNMYFFVLAVFLIGFLAIYRVIHSPFGDVLVAIRENEQRAISLGYDTTRYKLISFVVSAAVAGVGGALKILAFQQATLVDVHWSMSGEIILMTLIGGLGTIFGPMLGAAVVVTMQHYLSGLGAWVPVIQGLVFIITVLMFRRGIAGGLGALADRIQRRGKRRKDV